MTNEEDFQRESDRGKREAEERRQRERNRQIEAERMKAENDELDRRTLAGVADRIRWCEKCTLQSGDKPRVQGPEPTGTPVVYVMAERPGNPSVRLMTICQDKSAYMVTILNGPPTPKHEEHIQVDVRSLASISEEKLNELFRR